MERNFETVMIELCAPVLAGLKPAGLFRYETSDSSDLARRVRSWNAQLCNKGLRVEVLKGCIRTHQYLVYVYRESRLRAILAEDAIRSFLAQEGYTLPPSPEDFGKLIRQLSRRLCCASEFPHEIGIFLGPSPMCRGSSRIRGATSPAAAAGKPTAIRNWLSGISPSSTSVPRSICVCSTAVPPSPALLWRLNFDILFQYSLFILAPAGHLHAQWGEILLLTRGRPMQHDHCIGRLCRL